MLLKMLPKKTEEKITIANFQKTFPDIKRVPRIMAIDESTITFKKEHTVYQYNYKTQAIISQVTTEANANNSDYNNTANAVAYTLDNNLYVATKNNPKTAITTFSDTNIVSGQAIARFEFGISKGIFLVT